MNKKYNTLVLNRLYQPIHIVEWKRSISLLYQDAAKSLDDDLIPYDYKDWIVYTNMPEFDETNYTYVSNISNRIAIPNILVLQAYDRLPRRDTKYTRENVFSRDNHICAYCGKKFKRSELTIDHIIPKSRGGDNSWRNTISACKRCNGYKGNRTPTQAGMKLLYKPTEPRWSDRFAKVVKNPNLRPNWGKFLQSIGAV